MNDAPHPADAGPDLPDPRSLIPRQDAVYDPMVGAYLPVYETQERSLAPMDSEVWATAGPPPSPEDPPGPEKPPPCAVILAEAGVSFDERLKFAKDLLADFFSGMPLGDDQARSDYIFGFDRRLACLWFLFAGTSGLQDPRLWEISTALAGILDNDVHYPLSAKQALRVIVGAGKLLALITKYLSSEQDPRAV